AKSCAVTALRAIQSKIKVALRSGSMHFRINRAIVSFLINHQSLRASTDNWLIIPRFHRTDLDRNRSKTFLKSANTFGEIVATDESRVFTRDEKDLTKTLPTKMTRFGDHFINIQRDAKNRVIA